MAVGLRASLRQLGERVFSEQDSEQDRLNKTLAIFAAGLMGFGAMLWLVIYQAMGIRFSATVPFTYIVVSAASLGLFLWNRNFALYRFIQTTLFLFIPFVMQWNKRDVSSAMPVVELEHELNPDGHRSFEAIAINGTGVFDTLKCVSKEILHRLN